jgi:plasmid stabilization system protein ParE
MKYRVVLTARAERDRDLAFDWYSENYSREFANRWYRGLRQAIRSLRDAPFRCATAHENEKFSFELRELRFGGRRQQHRILFTLHEDMVLLLHIRHSAQRDLTEEDL